MNTFDVEEKIASLVEIRKTLEMIKSTQIRVDEFYVEYQKALKENDQAKKAYVSLTGENLSTAVVKTRGPTPINRENKRNAVLTIRKAFESEPNQWFSKSEMCNLVDVELSYNQWSSIITALLAEGFVVKEGSMASTLYKKCESNQTFK